MPLIRIGDDKTANVPTALDKLPIILIPGIYGLGDECDLIGHEIYQQSNYRRPVYIYWDDRVGSENNDVNFDISLNDLVESIAKAIQTTLISPAGSFPFFIIGHSYGCTLATLVAQHLQALGEEPHVYLIDGASPQCTKLHYENKKAEFMENIIHIMNYAAVRSHLKKIPLDSEYIKRDKLKTLTVEEAIAYIARAILLENDGEYLAASLLSFGEFRKIGKTNLSHYIDYVPSDLKPLPSITALITTATAKKYQDDYCGWQAHAEEIQLVTSNKKLLNTPHMDLLREGVKNKLVRTINRFLISAVPKEAFKKKLDLYIDGEQERCDNNMSDERTTDSDEEESSFSSNFSNKRSSLSRIAALDTDEPTSDGYSSSPSSYASSPSENDDGRPLSSLHGSGRLRFFTDPSDQPANNYLVAKDNNLPISERTP